MEVPGLPEEPAVLVPQGVQELPYRWMLAGYQRVEGVVVGLKGVGRTDRGIASFRVQTPPEFLTPLLANSPLNFENIPSPF